eukprot:scaffold3087_cov130-Alexandrium_tamarense.AAC.9
MLRADNSLNSEYVFAMITGSSGLYLQGRTSKGNLATMFGERYLTDPSQTSAWLRLVKKMDLIEMYRSDDRSEWTPHTSANIYFPNNAFRVGLAVYSHYTGSLLEATFDNYEINDAPTVWEPAVEIGVTQRAGSIVTQDSSGIARGYGPGTGTWG